MSFQRSGREYVTRKRWIAPVGLAIALAAAAIVGSAATGINAARQATVKVAIVTDIGGINDKGFNSLAYKGLQRAKKKLKISGSNGRAYITQSANDRLPNLTDAARRGYGLVIGIGFLMVDATSKVAPAFSSTKFAGID